jgi:sec-independent protein translocase protein TatB
VGLTWDKLLVILVIALFVLGPERLPIYAQKLGDLVKGLRKMASGAKDRMRDEMGPEFDEVDWKQLDPRQYDPRRIIRDALIEDENTPEARRARAAATARSRRIGGQGASVEGDVAATAAAAAGVSAGAGATEGPAAEDVVSSPGAFNFDDEAT